MPYTWTDTETIQSYLDADGTIQIGNTSTDPPTGNFTEGSAETFENQAVFEIRTLLAICWEETNTLTESNTPADIKRLAAQLTASKIATVRIGTAISDIPEWVKSYKNEVFAQVQRMLLNHKSDTTLASTLTVREDINTGTILLLMKTREQAVTQDV